ncbi:MAG TPA: YbdK family carboxylate-amine ligase [Thermoleophilaceae bacterium]|nr:YbdK family carboxylate-amine ligase [Thermoleophilaceae bacterium]
MSSRLPEWAVWQGENEYTLGAEEEVMLLNPHDWSLAQQIDRVLPRLPPELAEHVTRETHTSALELSTGVHPTAEALLGELRSLRTQLDRELAPLGLRAASAGTHPSTIWHETVVSSGPRYEAVYGSMRDLARREPTFGLHVHVGVRGPAEGIRLFNRMRVHLPLLLALSVNSPFWQGRDTGLASTRTPLFQAFPRVGIPRAFADYEEWVEAVDLLIRCDAFPEPTFLWWDVRPQPRFGTVEVRILDAQTTVGEAAALAALVQCIARLEIEEGYVPTALIDSQEALEENRFIAARDGMDARLIDPEGECRVPAREQLDALLEACAPHARELGCESQLEPVRALAQRTGARRQLELARDEGRLPGLVEALADRFLLDYEPRSDDSGETAALAS